MKSIRLITLEFSLLLSVLTTFPATTFASDAARVAGNLKVDGLYFSGDSNNTLITKPSDLAFPWTILGSDIYFLTGKVGIGTMTPASALDVNGTVNAVSFVGNGSGLSNVSAAVIDGSISTSKLAIGAVGDSQISGPITAGKLDLSGVQKKYGKIAVVAQSGGDYTDPATAMAAYASWCGSPSPTNPCLLKIMPGLYIVGTSSVQMQAYIDIEGSGENVTIIQGSLDGYIAGTVSGSNYAEIRFLTVKNTAAVPGASVVAINNSFATPKITNVTAISSGGYDCMGIRNVDNSSPTMTNVTVNASGGTSTNRGVYNIGSSPIMTNVLAVGSGGFENSGVYNYYSSPVMANVTATGLEGAFTYGVNNVFSSPAMTNITATANVTTTVLGGSACYGISGFSSSSVMNNVTAIASGGTYNYGVDNYESSPTMTNLTATASGGTTNIGVRNDTYGIVKINHSVIKGTVSIKNLNSATTFVGNTQLDGGTVNNVGTLTCVGTYNAGYFALNTNCQ